MQNRLMKDILPHFGVIFFPQATLFYPPAEVLVPSGGRDNPSRNKQSGAKDCLTYSLSRSSVKAMETIFLGGLVRLAEQTM
jgi:hypothetical protein